MLNTLYWSYTFYTVNTHADALRRTERTPVCLFAKYDPNFEFMQTYSHTCLGTCMHVVSCERVLQMHSVATVSQSVYLPDYQTHHIIGITFWCACAYAVAFGPVQQNCAILEQPAVAAPTASSWPAVAWHERVCVRVGDISSLCALSQL